MFYADLQAIAIMIMQQQEIWVQKMESNNSGKRIREKIKS